MEKFDYKREIIFWLLLLAPCIYILAVWNTLPDRVAIHFGIDGQPNGWGGKSAVLFVPAINLINYLILLSIPLIDPKKMSQEFFRSNFYKIRLLIVAFVTVLSIWLVRKNISGITAMDNWIPASVFLLIALLGNFMINIKPNCFVAYSPHFENARACRPA